MRKKAKKTAIQLEPYAVSARNTAGKRIVEAREWAAPRMERAADSVQATVAPKVTSALNTAAERLEPTKQQAQVRGTAAIAALKGETAKKKRRWTVAMLFFALGGALGAAAGMLFRKPEAMEEARARFSSHNESMPRSAMSPEDESPDAQQRADEPASVDGQPRG